MFKTSLFISLLLLVTTGYGQTISSLQDEITLAERDIKRSEQLLGKNINEQGVNESELSLVRSNIRNRAKIVKSLDGQVRLVKQSIYKNNKTISSLGKEMITLKKEYGKSLVSGYKNYKVNNYFLFLLSSADFNSLALRLYYLKLYSKQREEKAQKINSLSSDINDKVSSLKKEQDKINRLLADKNKEVKSLEDEEKRYNTMLAKLRSEEGNLNKNITHNRKLIVSLNAEIAKIVAEEAHKIAKESKTEDKKKHIAKLTGDFTDNKGKLPMPLSEGVVIEEFGIHPHPSQPKLSVNNKGINIASKGGSNVSAIFDGEVSKVFFFKGLGNTVMIRHGKYISVYSNIAKVSVKAGDKVRTGGKIGSLAGGGSNQTMHFELWNETTVINPALWLKM